MEQEAMPELPNQPEMPATDPVSTSENLQTDKKAESKRSWISELSQKPVFHIITFFIALIGGLGGVPGVFQLVSYFTDKAKFVFHPYSMTMKYSKELRQTAVFITGTVENNGEKPLLLLGGFLLKINCLNNEEIISNGSALPDKSFKIEGLNTIYKDVIDLQTVDKFLPNDPVGGTLAFVIDQEPTAIKNKALKYTIKCVDLSGKEFSSTFSPGHPIPVKEGIVWPQQGVTVLPPVIDTVTKK